MDTQGVPAELEKLILRLVELQGKKNKYVVGAQYISELCKEFPDRLGSQHQAFVKADLVDVSGNIESALEELEAYCLANDLPLNEVLSVVDQLHSFDKWPIPVPLTPKPPV